MPSYLDHPTTHTLGSSVSSCSFPEWGMRRRGLNLNTWLISQDNATSQQSLSKPALTSGFLDLAGVDLKLLPPSLFYLLWAFYEFGVMPSVYLWRDDSLVVIPSVVVVESLYFVPARACWRWQRLRVFSDWDWQRLRVFLDWDWQL